MSIKKIRMLPGQAAYGRKPVLIRSKENCSAVMVSILLAADVAAIALVTLLLIAVILLAAVLLVLIVAAVLLIHHGILLSCWYADSFARSRQTIHKPGTLIPNCFFIVFPANDLCSHDKCGKIMTS